ncbi:hypothetical protein IMSHALPRED_003172 [Imshaugia aleurites]|uniref:Peptidase C14 caspase domain-containing protein n=1 Tax=Imshaugia aleurites TaxID=172621 RepID=A0A8H3PJR9_9LECA|nr:hypothetical protein IMSHALPRED_003172 [Imshaugia aleurites]
MGTVDAVTDHWAVLIGINYYRNEYKNLSGCVRDVTMMKEFLEAAPMDVNIVTFTASLPSDPSIPRPAEQRQESWPTYDNITTELRNLTAKARPGNFVYIHYSGHGAPIRDTSEQHGTQKDLALVLFDDEQEAKGWRYLHGREFAKLLNEMVKKGLSITLVLDCCFSGSVVRHGDSSGLGIRTIDYDPTIDAAYPLSPSRSLSPSFRVSGRRDAHIVPKWLINPDGYTILSACGPHENTTELQTDVGIHGPLSYLLHEVLRSLRASGTQVTNQSLFRYLCTMFHAHRPQQRPMRYGNPNLSFFGGRILESNPSITSVFRNENEKEDQVEWNPLYLREGHAHGVQKGDEYALYPFDSSDDVLKRTIQAFTKVRVDSVGGLFSELVGIDQSFDLSKVETGWNARRLTCLTPRKTMVQLEAQIGNEDEWMTAAKRLQFMALSAQNRSSQPASFNVVINKLNEYEIVNESLQRVAGLPTIPLDRKGAMDCVLDILEHVARFKYIEAIENRIPNPSFENSFNLEIIGPKGEDERGILSIVDGAKFRITLKNNGQYTLYLHLYDLGPSWQIEDLILDGDAGDYLVVPPGDKREMEVKMTLEESPSHQVQYECEDIMKFFVTSKPSSFSALVMEKIPKHANEIQGPLRGDHNRLSNFLSKLSTPLRGEKDDPLDGEWVSRNYIVCTLVETSDA